MGITSTVMLAMTSCNNIAHRVNSAAISFAISIGKEYSHMVENPKEKLKDPEQEEQEDPGEEGTEGVGLAAMQGMEEATRYIGEEELQRMITEAQREYTKEGLKNRSVAEITIE
jgi:hypothetical protein